MEYHLFLKKRLLLALLVIPLCAQGQEFPTRPVRFIAPFPPGSGVDVVARLIGQKLTESWREQVIVDNRPGAAGIIGTEIAAKATPDGYTLLMGNLATHAVNVNLHTKLPYDPVRDFIPITLVGRVPGVIVVHPSLPANSVKELILLAKHKPGQLTFGSSGLGSSPHLHTELFKLLAKIDMIHVPYKGSALALNDLIGGRIHMYISNPLTAVPHVNSKRLKALGVTGAIRSIAMPDVPTIAEAGLTGYEAYNWYGVLVPKGVPKRIVMLLNTRLVAVLKSKGVSERLTKDGAEIVASTPDEFAQFIDAEIKAIAKVVKEVGLRLE